MAGTIDRETKINLTLAASAIAALGGAVWRNETGFSDLREMQRLDSAAREKAEMQARYEFEKLDLRLKSIEGQTDDRWRRSDMRAYIREANAGGSKLPPVD